MSDKKTIDAERYVLGSMMINCDSLNTAIEELFLDDFLVEGHKEIYLACRDLYHGNRECNLQNVLISLREKNIIGMSQNESMSSYLIGLTYLSIPIEFTHYLNEVIKFSTKRKISNAGKNIAALAESEEDADELLEKSNKLFSSLGNRSHVDQDTRIGKIIETMNLPEDVKRRRENYKKDNKWVDGIRTGFIDLDQVLFGLNPGQMTIIGSLTGVGKTTIGLNIALNAALQENVPTAYFSFEMTAENLIERVICSAASINSMDRRNGRLRPEEEERYLTAAGWFKDAPFYVEMSGGMTDVELRSRARRMIAAFGVKLIVVDYIGLVRGKKEKGAFENKQAEIQEISRSLKALSLKYDVHVICLAQFNREAAKDAAAASKPKIHQLRDSGALEHDADAVLILHRPDAHDATARPGYAELYVAKNRNGPAGVTIELATDMKATRFYNAVKTNYQPYKE